MIRAALGLVFVLACAGCAASEPQAEAGPDCRAAVPNAAAPDGQDCPDQAAGQMNVHMSGTAQFGVGVAR